jgi:hypothetical protein
MKKAELERQLASISVILKATGILTDDLVEGVKILERDRGICRADRYHLLQEERVRAGGGISGDD